jgi:hypothetical protein
MGVTQPPAACFNHEYEITTEHSQQVEQDIWEYKDSNSLTITKGSNTDNTIE